MTFKPARGITMFAQSEEHVAALKIANAALVDALEAVVTGLELNHIIGVDGVTVESMRAAIKRATDT